MTSQSMTRATDNQSTPRLGILGGGQLGLYLCQAARALGVASEILDPNPDAPAGSAADLAHCAALDDAAALAAMIEACDVITFELEAIPEPALLQLEAAVAAQQVVVHPNIDTLRDLADKGSQKVWMAAEGLPTLPFMLAPSNTRPEQILGGPLPLPLVQKARRGGYDGQGVQRLAGARELKKLWPVPSILEVALEKPTEVAVVTVRDAGGDIVVYPAVSMAFDDHFNAVNEVCSPARIDETLRRRCESLARQAATRMHGAGVFAVELFITDDNAIYINEISPRVHNSGHLTMEAFRHCQFEQHVRAVMGMPLAPIVPRAPAAVMLNLLHNARRPLGVSAPEPVDEWLDCHRNTRLHWYGKPANRAGRKLGHITATAVSPSLARDRARQGLRALGGGESQAGAIAS